MSEISDKKFAEVSQIGNYQYYHFYKCLLSEPKKYIGTHSLLLIGILMYYIFCAKYQHPVIILFTVIFHILVFCDMIVLAFRDPGIVPKILPGYENAQLTEIPFDTRNLSDFLRDQKRSYLTTQKTHLLRVKFCNECCLYRPQRTSHCY